MSKLKDDDYAYDDDSRTIEIGENLSLVLSITWITLCLTITVIGGCAVHGHYQSEAVKNLPKTHKIVSGIIPGFPVVKEKGYLDR